MMEVPILRGATRLGLIAAGIVLLAGCAPSPPEPRPATAEELQAFRDEQARQWWESFAEGAPMPVVEAIEELPPEESYERAIQCFNDAAIPGVTMSADGGWSYSGEGGFEDPLSQVVQAQWWICNEQYPSVMDDSFVKSPSELAWIYDFYVERYRPCLASLGYTFVDFPQRERFVVDTAYYVGWVPHDHSVSPMPTGPGWELIAARCPLPPLLDDLGVPANGNQD
jgi:hypothetical protein